MEKMFSIDKQFWIEEHSGKRPENGKHFHPYYEFYYLVQGEMVYFIEQKTYTVREGTLVVIPPYILHRGLSAEKSQRTRILIYLDKKYLEDFTREEPDLFDRLETAFYQINQGDRIHQIICELQQEFQVQTNPLMKKVLACELVLRLSRCGTSALQSGAQVSLPGKLAEILDDIHLGYASDMTLAATAQKYCMNPAYLSRIFKQNTGDTFSAYLNRVRIKTAVELLRKEDKNITEIAFSVGFHSCNHFCKTFKKIMGVSPLAYKKYSL